jgi:L-asparagine transporter-like permease
MAENNNPQTALDPAAGTIPSPVPLTPEEVVQQLRAIMERIPFPQAPPAHRPFRRRLSHVNPKFVDGMINAVGASPAAQAALSCTDADLRARSNVIDGWSTVVDETQSMARTILAGNDVRRQLLGLVTLQAFQICTQLARDGSDEQLNSYVLAMKRIGKFGRSRRRRPDTPPEETAKKA